MNNPTGSSRALEAACACAADNVDQQLGLGGAHAGRARSADRSGDHAEAAAWHAALGQRLILAGDFKGARDSYGRALELAPERHKWRAILGELETWSAQGDWRARAASSAYYDAVYATSKNYRSDPDDTHYAPIWARIRARLVERKATSVLDVGCGPGQFAEFLCRETAIAYHGFDFSAVAIGNARTRDVPGASFTRADAGTTDLFMTGAFDAIVCTEVLEHVPDDLGLLDRVAPGTYCLCSVPNFYAFSHVRFFDDTDQVAARYGDKFADFAIETCGIAGSDSEIFLFQGTKRP